VILAQGARVAEEYLLFKKESNLALQKKSGAGLVG
jgi:hypothetical protein